METRSTGIGLRLASLIANILGQVKPIPEPSGIIFGPPPPAVIRIVSPLSPALALRFGKRGYATPDDIS